MATLVDEPTAHGDTGTLLAVRGRGAPLMAARAYETAEESA